MGILATIIAGIPLFIGIALIVEGYDKKSTYKPMCLARKDGDRFIAVGIFLLVVGVSFMLAIMFT
jgi:hypothetical protein|tara:strand:+ start:646 stop:840 length:195 start_codon:yes stop_codon:yes gene_type:complete